MAVDDSKVRVSWQLRGKEHDGYMYGNPSLECPEGQEPNPETGKCEENYCEKSTIEAIESARLECESSGNQFSYSCSNETESWESECNGRDCSEVEGDSGDMRWDSGVFGSGLPSTYMCSGKGGGCTAAIDGSSAWCGESGWCYARFTVIGPSCDSTTGNLFAMTLSVKHLKTLILTTNQILTLPINQMTLLAVILKTLAFYRTLIVTLSFLSLQRMSQT